MSTMEKAPVQPTASAALKRRTRWFILGALVVSGIAFAVIAASGINENLVYYWTPTDLHANGSKAYGATIRLGGMVSPGSIRKLNGSTVEFDVHDGVQSVHVKTMTVPPQMFRDNIGVVVEGTMVQAGHFQSNRLMVSHNNEYKAPEKGHPVEKKELDRILRSVEEGNS
jgi:cytochrome c-type biogenesis protein CcmE